MQIAALDSDDGLRFALDSARADEIREGDTYSGVRVSMVANLAGARLSFHIDVNFGDPIWPAPREVEVPRLLGGPPIRLMGYPLPMVLAEKLVTVVSLGGANTGWRDFADLWSLTRQHLVDGDDLGRAVAEVASYRGVALLPLAQALAGFDVTGQARWTAWRTKQRLTAIPDNFGDAVTAVTSFGEPVVLAAVTRRTWDPSSSTWVDKHLRH